MDDICVVISKQKMDGQNIERKVSMMNVIKKKYFPVTAIIGVLWLIGGVAIVINVGFPVGTSYFAMGAAFLYGYVRFWKAKEDEEDCRIADSLVLAYCHFAHNVITTLPSVSSLISIVNETRFSMLSGRINSISTGSSEETLQGKPTIWLSESTVIVPETHSEVI